MTVEELIEDIGIEEFPGDYASNGAYIIDIDNSDDYGKVFSKLDNCEDLEYDEYASTLTVDNSNLRYSYGDEFEVVLIGNFRDDSYRCVISEL